MKVKLNFELALVVVMSVSSLVWAVPIETREYILGDIDNFVYDGFGSIDDVYYDADWLALTPSEMETIVGFDIGTVNHRVPFSFIYDLAENETVVGASLTIGLRSGSGIETDLIKIENPLPGNYYLLVDLGWLPLSTTETQTRTLDLSNVAGFDLLHYTQDGQLDVYISDDAGVDYATLSIQVVPEPTTLLLLGLGTLMLRKKANYLEG